MIILDETDRALITLLRHDARASVTELAARAGLSRVTVAARIKALRDKGVIRRFTVDLAEPIEEETIRARSLLELNLAKTDRVHRALARMPEITSLYTTNGKWALVATHETPNLVAFDALLLKLCKLDGISNVEACLHLTRLVFTPGKIETGIEHARNMASLREIGTTFEGTRLPPPPVFWQQYDAGEFD